MNEVEVFNFEANEVRTVIIENEAWFVGKDVATTLGYKKPENAIATHVDYDDKTTTLIQGSGSNYKSKTTLVNESGLYSLIFGSKLTSAKRFKKWVTSEVLPAIRKTGGYQVKEMTNDEIVGQALRIEHDRAERLAVELSVTKPKAEMHDVFIEKGQAIGIREASKELNVKQNDLIDNLMNNGYVYRTKGHNGKLQPIKKYVPKYFVLKSASVNGVEFTPQMLITPQGREFFYKKFYAPDQIEMTL
ncbi:phage antirepressor KilAC domain-containing protein [Leuconostoc mesenteroides]|uniref:phage antirepressor KilAC domain-containing protein n=1 Tax=Leuconostoc mesenteroides TaxID=1245 RepID=UPI001CC02750|nr:phage antirepressor KilAC domain-containing protein [Leuconostoc mesenteroides]MBZ1518311.1 phage antirepressor KilAC domain-containing protein [Leuconostoc mesenteroides]MBZ1520380.1 phage antirepressor KilAC domain-containing protein [Leuconostoc mesenteroides]